MFGRPGDQLAVGIQDQAGSVEDEIVVAAHLIDEHQRAAPAAGGGGQHARAQVPLLDGVGRGGDVDQDLGALGHQLLDGIFPVQPLRPEVGVVPDVLADRDAEAAAAQFDAGDVGGRLEIPPLVEHVVGGQQRLAVQRHHAALVQQRRAVGDASTGARLPRRDGFGKTDQQGRVAGAGHQLLQGPLRVGDERRPFQQIPRRIPGHRQLGRDQQRRPGGLGAGQRFVDQPDVRREVPDGRVQLPQGDLHRVILTASGPWPSGLRQGSPRRAGPPHGRL